MRGWARCLAPTLAALAWSAAGATEREPALRATASLDTFEGEVTALVEQPGESGLALVAVDLDLGDGEAPRRILLAPRATLDEIGFEVEVGDRLKVRVFAESDPPVRAQRVLNASRSSLVRLRTLRQVPLWSSTGAWQGGGPRGGPGSGPRSPRAGAGGRPGGSGGNGGIAGPGGRAG